MHDVTDEFSTLMSYGRGEVTYVLMDEMLALILDHLDDAAPGGLIGVYLYGSAATRQLQHDSDIDLLMLTSRSLTDGERTELVAPLLNISGWKGHAESFPEAASRRPIELTSLVYDDVHALTASPRLDFQYGEWLRTEFEAGTVPKSRVDPDVVILLATALHSNEALRGPKMDELLQAVPEALLRRCMVASIPGLLEELPSDQRNVLLTLARIVVTLEAGNIVAKDVAAETIAQRLSGNERGLLEYARAGYLGELSDEWADEVADATALASTLAALAYEADAR